MTGKIGADKDRLARRAAAAMGGWQTGMVEEHGATCCKVLDGEPWLWFVDDCVTEHEGEECFPDPESPATQGCLFARVREIHCVTELEALGYILDLMVTRQCGYAEALVIGLEAGR